MTLPHGGQIPEPSLPDPDGEEHLDLSDIAWDDGLVFITFWALALIVFLQFFTRYVLNDSYSWTEEIARYLLIWVTFFGLFMAVRKESNVAVEVFYRWMPMGLRRLLSSLVDAVVIAFYGTSAWLCVELAMRTRQSMTSIDWPKSVIYWGVTFGLAVATLYALAIAWRHWRTKSSPLIGKSRALIAPERPGMD